MSKYECMTDEELIEKLRAGDKAIMDYIMENIKILCERRQTPCT